MATRVRHAGWCEGLLASGLVLLAGCEAGAASRSRGAFQSGTGGMNGSVSAPTGGSGGVGGASDAAGVGGAAGGAGAGGGELSEFGGADAGPIALPWEVDSSTRDAGAQGGDDASNPVPGALPEGLLGVYTGNDPADITQFEAWLGQPVDGILGYTSAASWSDYDASVGSAIELWSALDRSVFWSVPLIPTGASLEAAANGDYDAHYTAAAQQLADFRPGDPVVYIRTGWEFNGDWYPWTAQGKAAAFVGAFRHFVAAFRAESDRFVFEWNVNVGDVGMNPEEAYPGDDYVDIIGMDFYWNTQWDPADANAAWDSMLNRMWGLNWHQQFAVAHGKRTSYSEWGVKSDAAGPYIEKARAWFEAHDVVLHTYWNTNNNFQGKLSDNQYPNAAIAYKSQFGP